MRIQKPLAERLRSDEGLSLIECLMALIIFGIVAGGLSFALQAAGHTSANNRLRVQAANLAARELEIDRNEFNATAAGPVSLGASGSVSNPHNILTTAAAGSPLVLDGVPFTVARDVQWLPTGTGESPCDGGSLVTYPTLKVTASVTWNNMGNTKPIANSTLLTPPKTLVATTTAFIAVKVTGANGSGVDNMPVVFTKSASTQTIYTESDGCAVFATTDYGNWTATLSKLGYVTTDLFPSRSLTTNVTAGSLSQVPMSYDRAVTINAMQASISGYLPPTSLPPLTLYNTGLPAPDVTKVTSVTAASTLVSGLWPFTDGYSIWAGSCDQSTPAPRPAGVALVSGVTAPYNQAVALAPVDILVRTHNLVGSGYTFTSGAIVLATPAALAGCAASDSLTLGTTDVNGQLKTSLPYGAYTISVKLRSTYGATAWPVTAANLSTTTPTTISTISLA
jgi:prepilin-type N-terminal cleavage/methylation domain-containing protein